MSNNPLASVLEHMLESEEVFWTYLSNNSNIHQAYKACKHLLRVAGEVIDEQNQRAAKVARLQQEVKEHKNARMRMRGALTYVEKQLNTLRATQTTPAPVAPTPPVALTPSIVYPMLPTSASTNVGSPAPASVASE